MWLMTIQVKDSLSLLLPHEKDSSRNNKIEYNLEDHAGDWDFDEPNYDVGTDIQANVDKANARLSQIKESRREHMGNGAILDSPSIDNYTAIIPLKAMEKLLVQVMQEIWVKLHHKFMSKPLMIVGSRPTMGTKPLWERCFTVWDPGQKSWHLSHWARGQEPLVKQWLFLLQIMGGKHQTRVNGWRLKPYFSQVFDEQVDSAEVNLDSGEPLGLIAQDPHLAQHVPCILSMSIGPITRPCIDTILCNPGTSMEHISIDREDECTSRLQESVTNEEALEQEA